MRRYFDLVIEKGRKLPSPTSYECNTHRKDAMYKDDPRKKGKIMMHDRKSSMDVVVKHAQAVPGVGKY